MEISMEELKQFFGEDGTGSITYEELSKGIAERGIKLADLSLGGYVSKDKYDEQTRKFTDYKAKNDVSRYADYETIKAELETLKAQEMDRQLMEKVAKGGVRHEFQRFVLAEVKAGVTEDKPFDKVLEAYLKDNTQYLSSEETKATFFKSSSARLENGVGDVNNINQRMNALIRGVKK